MSNPPQNQQPGTPGQTPGQTVAKFDPNAAHQLKPRLRSVRAFPAKYGDQQVMGLADARQITDRVVLTTPAAQFILPHLSGEKSLDQIVADVGRGLQKPFLEGLVAQLDEAGLLFGPRFDAIQQKMRAEFDASTNLPPGSTLAFADALASQDKGKPAAEIPEDERAAIGTRRLGEIMDQWMDKALEKAEKPSFDALPRAIMAPHLDYNRGWLNYASVWGRMRVVDRPDRVIVLGTNHFGLSSGVCGCPKGYETPLGTCPVDQRAVDALDKRLGAAFWANRFDHEREHSVELQVAWIQHCLGKDDAGSHCPVMGILVHDPAVNNGASYDGQGIAFEPFVEALRATIDELPGRTLLVSSADLSHAGPAFGDKQAVNGEAPEATAARDRVVQHDREMLELVRQNKPMELIAALSWMQNPTRWCSLGNITATMLASRATSVQVLNYMAAIDQQGLTMVSSAAAVMN